MHQEFKQGRFDGVKSVSKVTKRRSRSLFSRVAVVITSALSLLVTPVINAEGVSNSNEPRDASPILQSVIDTAKASAEESYEQNDHGLDDGLKSIDYQTYRAIRFNPEKKPVEWRERLRSAVFSSWLSL